MKQKYFLTFIVLFLSFVYIGGPAIARADTGLVAHWTMDDGSGSTATDSSGNGNNESISGTATWVSGKIGGALSFDGNTYAHLSTFNTTPTSTMTLCSWVKTSSATDQAIIGFGRNPGSYGNEGIFSIRANGSIQFWDHQPPSGSYGFSNSVADNSSSNTVSVVDGHWHLVCFVKNNTAGTYYIDGIASGTTTAAVNINYDNSDWTLGKDYRDNDWYFNGLMDDARVYDIALQPSDIAALYGAVAYWKFDEGSGTVANDSTGNNNTGTLVGSPTWTTGKYNDALDFENGQYVSVGGTPISSSTVGTGQITGTAWIYANSATTSGTIIKDWPDDSANDEFQFGFEGTTTKISAYIEQSNGTIIGPVESPVPLPLNSWHSVAFTANGTSVMLYVDGAIVASTTYNGTLHQGGNYISIGAKLNNIGSPAASPAYFDGDIDDVHLYNRGLLPEEILNLMEALPGQVLDLQASGTYTSGFSLAWDPNPVGDNVTDYLVQYSTNNGNSWTTVDTASTSTSYTLSNVPPGDYLFRVEASNVLGQGELSVQVGINSPVITYDLGNDCLALEHISDTPGDAYGHYVMSGNIDCSVVANFIPINFPSGFGGIFDGGGNTISNLYISTTTDDVGLFSQIQNGGIVKNLDFSNANIANAGSYSGILTGYNNGTLQNISASGTSTGVFYVGGLVGKNDSLGTISTSSTNVSVIGDNSGNGGVEDVGGFAGDNEGSIDHSYSSGSVTNAVDSEDFYFVGGFVGHDGGGVLSYDYSTAPVTVNPDSSQESEYIGGFAGDSDSGATIDHSYATGNVTDSDDDTYEVGGFIGNSSATLTNDHATGDLYIANDSSGDPYYFGGFMGGGDAGSVSNCYATGSFAAAFPGTFEYVGGFAGYNEDPISDSYSTGSVEGSSYTGGFSGYSQGVLSEVFSTSNITLFGSSPEYVGGLVGINYDDIDDAYSTGNISLDSSVTGGPIYIGGLIGYNYYPNINRAYASGDVSAGTSSSDIGGLVGIDFQDSNSITNSYSIGSITGGSNVGGLIGFESLDNPGNPSYNDLAWNTGSASDAVGDFQNNGGTDNGPIQDLVTGGYGIDESTVSNFYSTTEPVYAEGQGGAWDFGSIWDAHADTFPTFQWFSPPTPATPTPPPAPSGSGYAFPLGCLDPNASNYNPYSSGDPSLCTYASTTTASVATTTGSSSAMAAALSGEASSTLPTAMCTAQTYPTRSIKFGAKNDPAQVILLQNYLNTYENAGLAVDGVYSSQDEAAVIKWQEKYAAEILTPWHITKGTGYIYTTSLLKFKSLFLAECQEATKSVTQSSIQSSRDLELGMSGADVSSLQQALILKNTGVAAEALAKNGVTDYFGQLTKAALIEFQKYVGITPAVGYYGAKTKAVLSL